MAFAEHLTATKRTGGTLLLVDAHLAAMPDDEATDARKLLASDLSDAQVSEAFHAESYAVSAAAVGTWRRRNKVSRYTPPVAS